MVGGVIGRLGWIGGVVLMGGVVPVMGSSWIVPRRAASRAAPSALRFAAAASLICVCSDLRCSLLGF